MSNLIRSFLLTLFTVFLFVPVSYAQTKIVTTTGQLRDAVKQIAGSDSQVVSLMGAGVDPHLYKATESDIMKLADADIIFYNGLYLEAKMEEVLENMSRRQTVINVGGQLDKSGLLPLDASEHYDPHIWFDVKLWMQVVDIITQALIENDPAKTDIYEQRKNAYKEELVKLDGFVNSRVNELPEGQRVLVTAHDAFRYFGQAYGFEVIGLQGISTDSEAGTKDVIKLADLIFERKIKAVFIESSIPERTIKAVQDAVRSRGWEVVIGGELFSDAMGNEGSFEGTYLGMVTHNINTIVDALK